MGEKESIAVVDKIFEALNAHEPDRFEGLEFEISRLAAFPCRISNNSPPGRNLRVGGFVWCSTSPQAIKTSSRCERVRR